MREEGLPFPTIRALAKKWDCSEGLIRKAISKSVVLKGWQARQKGNQGAPRATRLSDVVLEKCSQTREAQPSDVLPREDVDRVMEYLMREAKPPERERLEAMSFGDRQRLVEAYLSQRHDEDSEGRDDLHGARAHRPARVRKRL